MRSWQRGGVELQGECSLRSLIGSKAREGNATLQTSCGKALALNGMANVSESLLPRRD